MTQLNQAKEDAKKCYEIIYEAIKHDNEAVEFMHLYAEYCHLIDDIIDEPFSAARILKTFNFATLLYSQPFWIRNKDALILVDCLINNQYADSVSWEKSNDEWKRQHAQALSHAAYNMMFAIVLIVAGYDKLREISEKFRTHSHLKHLNH